MQENRKVKGLAVFSKEEQVKKRSLKLYTYFVCHSFLRNEPNQFGDNVRIFKQRDINLQDIKRALGLDPETTKKYLGLLEDSGLIRFTPRGWKEERDNEGQLLPMSERWKERRKHKETYYEIPAPPAFRKIPKETLIELNETFCVNEFTIKLYIVLSNYQESCIKENQKYWKFTYQDIRDIFEYASNDRINKKIGASLFLLREMGLIELETGNFVNKFGVSIPCFVLNQVNFYLKYDFKDYQTGEYSIIDESIKNEIIQKYKGEYSEAFN